MMGLIKWGMFVAVAAVAVHYAAVAYLPNIIMWRASTVMATKSANTIAHGDRPNSDARVVVKPSPDLLYSRCLYDVTRTPLKITTAAPTDTYWSVALYGSNTDNFYVLNDSAAKGQPATIILMGQGQSIPPQPEGTLIVTAPTPKGLVLFRTLISDDAREAELDKQRRAATCDPLRP
jgi:uncharacterized membrane protein